MKKVPRKERDEAVAAILSLVSLPFILIKSLLRRIVSDFEE